MAISAVAIIPLSIVLYALNLYIPSIVIDRLTGSKEFVTVVITIVALLAAQLVFNLIQNYVSSKGATSHLILNNLMSYMIFVHGRDMDDYLHLEKGCSGKTTPGLQLTWRSANEFP